MCAQCSDQTLVGFSESAFQFARPGRAAILADVTLNSVDLILAPFVNLALEAETSSVARSQCYSPPREADYSRRHPRATRASTCSRPVDAAGDRHSVAGLALEMLQARKRGPHFHYLLGKSDASYFDYFL